MRNFATVLPQPCWTVARFIHMPHMESGRIIPSIEVYPNLAYHAHLHVLHAQQGCLDLHLVRGNLCPRLGLVFCGALAHHVQNYTDHQNDSRHSSIYIAQLIEMSGPS